MGQIGEISTLAGLSAMLRDDSDCNSRVGADRARGLVEE